jgi:hypothetical protein
LPVVVAALLNVPAASYSSTRTPLTRCAPDALASGRAAPPA